MAAVDAWWRQCNDAIYSIVNPKPGEATQPIDSFLQQAKETAEEGTWLAREVVVGVRRLSNLGCRSLGNKALQMLVVSARVVDVNLLRYGCRLNLLN